VISGDDFVNVFITSNCKSFSSEKKFGKDLTLSELRGKLELITGASALSMKIAAFDKHGEKICDLDGDEGAMLGSFPLDNGVTIHAEDASRRKGEFEDTAAVEKFELSKEEYGKRENTVQSFLKRNKLGKYNEEEMKRIEEEKARTEAEEKAKAAAFEVGARCEVRVPDNLARRGAVRYVGKVHFKPGYWIGVQYDEPLGKNDGSVDGRRYFECPQKYGGFVRLAHCVTGDFPEEDLGLSDEEDEI